MKCPFHKIDMKYIGTAQAFGADCDFWYCEYDKDVPYGHVIASAEYNGKTYFWSFVLGGENYLKNEEKEDKKLR